MPVEEDIKLLGGFNGPMFKKIYPWISVFILLALLISSNIYNCSLRRSNSERAAELERRAVKYENLYAETNQLYSEALGAIERTEIELAGIREANSRLRGIESDLRTENRILERTINELGELHSELAEGTGRAEELIQAIEGEARRALECLGRLQAGSGGTD